ncbi:MAG TPA: DUF1614 domain-containing protein [Methylococcaceae bacterium]|nr:DUF1614 domain-containing protein [Methylococcaceae bacterium]
MPLTLPVLLLLFLLLGLQFDLMTFSFEKLGLSHDSAVLLLFTALFGGLINLPVVRIAAEAPEESFDTHRFGMWRLPRIPFTGRTLIAVNVGGCLVPLAFSAYLLVNKPLPPEQLVPAVAAVSALSYVFSRPIPGLGIAMPGFVAPVSAALAAFLLAEEALRAEVAYIAGTTGVLIGADLLRIKDIRRMGAPIASIGGAGTFDGIFMTGLVAALLT